MNYRRTVWWPGRIINPADAILVLILRMEGMTGRGRGGGVGGFVNQR